MNTDTINQANLYNKYNTWQIKKGLELIQQAVIKADQNIVDIGCGTGELTYILANKVLPKGKIFALDPDNARITLAQNNQPVGINNISWYNQGIESINEIPSGSIDLAYANYVMHWVPNKENALKIIYNLLKPGGTFIMNCITMHSEIIVDLAKLCEEFNKTFINYDIFNKENWISLFHLYKFDILETNNVDDFFFNNLDEFLKFWEAASHAKFKREMLSHQGYHSLLKKYPGEFGVFGKETFNVRIVKTKR